MIYVTAISLYLTVESRLTFIKSRFYSRQREDYLIGYISYWYRVSVFAQNLCMVLIVCEKQCTKSVHGMRFLMY